MFYSQIDQPMLGLEERTFYLDETDKVCYHGKPKRIDKERTGFPLRLTPENGLLERFLLVHRHRTSQISQRGLHTL